jgi:hypothetical protein
LYALKNKKQKIEKFFIFYIFVKLPNWCLREIWKNVWNSLSDNGFSHLPKSNDFIEHCLCWQPQKSRSGSCPSEFILFRTSMIKLKKTWTGCNVPCYIIFIWLANYVKHFLYKDVYQLLTIIWIELIQVKVEIHFIFV